MSEAISYPKSGAVIGAVLGFIVVLIMKNRDIFIFNDTLLDLVIMGVVVGGSIGAIADMVGKGDMFADRAGGIVSSVVYGAVIGAVMDPKFSQPVPRAIAGAIVGVIAFVLYNKLILRHFADKDRKEEGAIKPWVIVIFGLVIGAIYGAMIIISNGIYSVTYLSDIIIGNNVSINDYIINEIYYNLPIGIFIGAIIGSFFGTVFAIIQATIGSKGAIGGAIVGFMVIGEALRAFFPAIIGGLITAIIGARWSKSRLRSMVAGATVIGSACALISAFEWLDVIPTYIDLIFIVPSFLIIGYYSGMILTNE